MALKSAWLNLNLDCALNFRSASATMKVFIQPNSNYYSITRYVLKLIEKNVNQQFQFVDAAEHGDIIWDTEHPKSEPIAIKFYDEIKEKSLDKNHFASNTTITTNDLKKDSIATIFFMVNCMQEFNPSAQQLDSFGRFKFEASYQSRLKNIEQNLVQKEIDALCLKWNITPSKKKSTFFISHDIDTIYGSFLQDGFWALKNMKIGVVLSLILWEFTNKQHWKNIDQIIKLNSEKDILSTFFWIVNKGKGLQEIKNADYDINQERHLLKMVDDSKFVNGLHKSCSTMSIDEELKKGNINSTFNRYHFLKFLSHSDWKKVSDSALTFDCSLGFAEHYGFRNSYGKAFQPFDVLNNKPFDFVEAPLHFMDGTFHKYMKIARNETAKNIINFYENNSVNCDFSLLWHNTYFTNYKYHSFLDEYKKILAFIYENKIECVMPNQLINENKIAW